MHYDHRGRLIWDRLRVLSRIRALLPYAPIVAWAVDARARFGKDADSAKRTWRVGNYLR